MKRLISMLCIFVFCSGFLGFCNKDKTQDNDPNITVSGKTHKGKCRRDGNKYPTFPGECPKEIEPVVMIDKTRCAELNPKASDYPYHGAKTALFKPGETVQLNCPSRGIWRDVRWAKAKRVHLREKKCPANQSDKIWVLDHEAIADTAWNKIEDTESPGGWTFKIPAGVTNAKCAGLDGGPKAEAVILEVGCWLATVNNSDGGEDSYPRTRSTIVLCE